MKIREVAITAHQLGEAAAFYRDVLEMPVEEQLDRVTVKIGSSRLIIAQGDPFEGVHHLAFGISPHDFDLARTWLRGRVEPIVAGGSEVIDGPEGWNSLSVYFLGPEGIVLELIARGADAAIPGSGGAAPRPLSISEVGIGVPDTSAAVRELTQTLALPTFPPQEPQFAPIGNHDGLLILVDHERVWFPTRTHQPARGPLSVRIDGFEHPRELLLTPNTSITAYPVIR